MGFVMILISGSEDTGYEATIKMGRTSTPIEISFDYEGSADDICHRDFTLKIDASGFNMPVEDGFVKIKPERISLDTGIYPFQFLMDGKSIMQGYFEWLGDDN